MPAQKQKIFQICPQCRGSKVIPITQTTPEEGDPEPSITTTECPHCLGEDHVEWGYLLVPNP